MNSSTKNLIAQLLSVADGSDNADLCIQAAELLQRWSDPTQLWWVDIAPNAEAFSRHNGEVTIILGNAFEPDEDHDDFVRKMPVLDLVIQLRNKVASNKESPTPTPDPYAEARLAFADGELEFLFLGNWMDWHKYTGNNGLQHAAPSFNSPPSYYRRRPQAIGVDHANG